MTTGRPQASGSPGPRKRAAPQGGGKRERSVTRSLQVCRGVATEAFEIARLNEPQHGASSLQDFETIPRRFVNVQRLWSTSATRRPAHGCAGQRVPGTGTDTGTRTADA